MTSLGFENYAEALKIYLTKYREVSYFLLFSFSNATSPLLKQTFLGAPWAFT
jgi:hypothetical protein